MKDELCRVHCRSQAMPAPGTPKAGAGRLGRRSGSVEFAAEHAKSRVSNASSTYPRAEDHFTSGALSYLLHSFDGALVSYVDEEDLWLCQNRKFRKTSMPCMIARHERRVAWPSLQPRRHVLPSPGWPPKCLASPSISTKRQTTRCR